MMFECQSNEICFEGICVVPPQFTLLPVVQSPQSINANLPISTFSVYDLAPINSASVQFGTSTASCTIQTSLTQNYYAISCPQTISYSTSGTKTIGFIVGDTLSASTNFNSQTLITLWIHETCKRVPNGKYQSIYEPIVW